MQLPQWTVFFLQKTLQGFPPIFTADLLKPLDGIIEGQTNDRPTADLLATHVLTLKARALK